MRLFLRKLKENVLDFGINVCVKVTYFREFNSPNTAHEREVIAILHQFQRNYTTLEFKFISAEGPFSRGKGLQIGAQSCAPNSLIFFCDIDMNFNHIFFRRLLKNVRPGVAYLPIIFSQYNPGMSHYK